MNFGQVFRISARSMAALEKYAEEAYLDRLVSAVAELAPPEESPEELRQVCRALVRRAREWGFETEREVAVYAACGFAAGEDFEERSPWRGILDSPGMSTRSKSELLMLVLENLESDAAEGAED